MEKTKSAFVNRVLAFADRNLDGLTEKQSAKVLDEIHSCGDAALTVLLPPKPYGAGVMTRRGKESHLDEGKKEVLKRIQGVLRVFVNGWVTGRPVDEDLGDVKLNFSMNRSDTWSLAVTTDGPPTGMDSRLWRLLVGMGWALHSMPADCLKRCTRPGCSNLFLQKTKRHKDYCNQKCAVQAVDSRRQGTERRKQQQREAQERAYKKKVALKRRTQAENITMTLEPGRKRKKWSPEFVKPRDLRKVI